jgi:hypothetical protein
MGTAYPVILYHIPEEWIPQPHHCGLQNFALSIISSPHQKKVQCFERRIFPCLEVEWGIERI